MRLYVLVNKTTCNKIQTLDLMWLDVEELLQQERAFQLPFRHIHRKTSDQFVMMTTNAGLVIASHYKNTTRSYTYNVVRLIVHTALE